MTTFESSFEKLWEEKKDRPMSVIHYCLVPHTQIRECLDHIDNEKKFKDSLRKKIETIKKVAASSRREEVLAALDKLLSEV